MAGGAAGSLAGVRAVLFDLGGTLGFDLPPAEVVPSELWPPGAGAGAVGAALVRAADRYYRLYHLRRRQLPLRRRLEVEWLLALRELGVDRRAGAPALARRLAGERGCPVPFRAYPEVESVLVGLRLLGFRLGLVSNAPRHAAAILAAANLHGHFRVVLISEAVGVAKPDPRIFMQALAACGVSRRQALFVGNDPECDAGGAAAAGIRAVLVDRHGRLDRGRWAWPVVADLRGVLELLGGKGVAGGAW